MGVELHDITSLHMTTLLPQFHHVAKENPVCPYKVGYKAHSADTAMVNLRLSATEHNFPMHSYLITSYQVIGVSLMFYHICAVC